jgi:X-Pro dipeptidyl-peptidase
VRCRVSVRRRYNETQPVHDYAKAVREKVYVETPVDSDRDGKRDKLSIFVTRPKETDGVLKVATIVEPSPDFGGTVDAEYPSGRRYRRAEGGAVVTAVRAVGRRELRPRVLDNYFVRGYAVLSAATLGTGDSEGCPTAIGTGEKIGMKTVVEWLTGQEVTVSWSTGKSRWRASATTGPCGRGGEPQRWGSELFEGADRSYPSSKTCSGVWRGENQSAPVRTDIPLR